MNKYLLNFGAMSIVLCGGFVTGTAILNFLIGSNVFISVTDNIITVVNFVYDLIFSSLNLLSFFVRPSTLSFVAHLFIAYWACWIEFKFLIACTKITLRCYDIGRSFLSSAVSLIAKLFIRV